MRPAILLILFIVSITKTSAQADPNTPAQAQVTFYSNGVTALGGLPGKKAGAFKGRIFDEDRQLAFLEPGHFITFTITPGSHVFSATPWTASHAKNGAHVTVDVVAGEHYFIQALVLSTYLGSTRIFINQVVCEGASQEAAKSKPLEPAHLRPDGATIAVAETSFPHCL